MGKKKGGSLFAAIRRVFCSPSAKRSKKRDENEVKLDRVERSEVSKVNANHSQEIKIVHLKREDIFSNAAVVIQTAFRGYLARRALLAMKGIVKLQAFIRGNNVRKQARLTLKCMQALVNLQEQMVNQQKRVSNEMCRISMFCERNSLWDGYKLDIKQRKSTSAGRCSYNGECDLFLQCRSEDDEGLVKRRNKDGLKREKALAYALSQQLRRFDSNINSRTEWLNRWMATKNPDPNRRDSITSAQVDTLVASHLNKALVLQMNSASPRHLNEESRRHSTTNTPSSISKYSDSGATTPHYMTSTESAKAKARFSSQRPCKSGRERVRKRLSYPVSEQIGGVNADNGSSIECLRSPSFKSALPYLEIGAYANSYYGESACEDISPASTTHIRRWMK